MNTATTNPGPQTTATPVVPVNKPNYQRIAENVSKDVEKIVCCMYNTTDWKRRTGNYLF